MSGIELFNLILKDRTNHVNNDILPALKQGEIVISDRYVLSSLVFQRLDNLQLEYIWSRNCHFIIPNFTFIINVDENIRNSRLESRGSLSRLKLPEMRWKEAQYTKEASDFLESKGWNITWINNSNSLIHAVNFIEKMIFSL